MQTIELFWALGWVIGGGAVAALLGRLAKLPTIVAYLLAGLVLGPFLGLVEPTQALAQLSKLGVALLLFLVGLELSFDKLKTVGPVAVVAGLGQVIFTAAGGMVLCLLMGFGWMESLFLSVALTFSSTVVVVKILADKNELDTLYGRIAVGIFLVQDIIVVLVITLLAGLQGGGAGEDAGWARLGIGMARAFGGTAVLLGVAVAASRWLLPRVLTRAASSPSVILVWSLAWCFALVQLASLMELSIELGAFFAGLSLAQLPHNRDLQHRIRPLMNLFVAIFFVTLGLGISPSQAATQGMAVAVLSLFVLLGNPLIFFVIIAAMGYSRREAFLAGVTVAQISEFSFVFVAMGVGAGLVDVEIAAITAMVGIFTIAASAYLILYNSQLFEVFAKILRWQRSGQSHEDEGGSLTGHIIVVGMNTLGRRLAEELARRGHRVLAVDTDARKLAGLPCETVVGSSEYLDVLLDAGLPRARLVISALKIEEANELLAYRCCQFGVPCCVHAVDLSVVDNLLELGVAYLMLSKVDGVKLQNRLLRERGLLPA